MACIVCLTMETTVLKLCLWRFFWDYVKIINPWKCLWFTPGTVGCYSGSWAGLWVTGIVKAGPDSPWWISWTPNHQAEGKSFTSREPHLFLVRSQIQINRQMSHYPLSTLTWISQEDVSLFFWKSHGWNRSIKAAMSLLFKNLPMWRGVGKLEFQNLVLELGSYVSLEKPLYVSRHCCFICRVTYLTRRKCAFWPFL